MTTTRRRLIAAAFWLLAALLLWAALYDLDWRLVGAVLRSLTAGQLLTLALLNSGIVLLLASRWWLILRGQGYRVPFLSAAAYRLAAFGVSYFTAGPHFGGEPLQIALTLRRQGIPAAAATASVLLDKLFELMANFTFLGVGVYALISASLLEGRTGAVGLAVAVGLFALPIAYFVALASGGGPLTAIGRRIGSGRRLGRGRGGLPGGPPGGLIGRLAALAEDAEREAAGFLRERKIVFMLAVLLSALIWGSLVMEFRLAMRFLGLDLGLPEAIGVIAAARIAILLPVPAGLGALEAALVLVTQALGEPASAGAGLSLLVRARDTSFALAGLWLGRRLYVKPLDTMENG